MTRERSKAAAGFTLIELVITMLVASILAATAVMGYQNVVRKSRRADAKSTLQSIAHRLERCLSQSGVYNNTTDCPITSPADSDAAYYRITVTRAATTYTLTATPQGPQAADTHCATFTLNNLGEARAKDSANNTVTDCW